jgi:DUF971 family protein
MADAPTNIRALQAPQILELTWNNGRVDPLPYRLLRGECPCASCRDEWTGARIIDPAQIPDDIRLEGMEPVGSYAVRLAWTDGHSSGLYTWENLQRLAENPEPSA